MKLFRLSKLKYSKDLSGKGAELAGGRWNSKGTAMLYTSGSLALSTTEVAVHVPLGILPKGYYAITYEVPTSVSIQELSIKDLPKDWKSIPHSHSTQQIGDLFIKSNAALILKVPSAVIRGDFNFLINPSHPDLVKIKIRNVQEYEFDERLFKR
jgi:RES domain-containing protein